MFLISGSIFSVFLLFNPKYISAKINTDETEEINNSNYEDNSETKDQYDKDNKSNHYTEEQMIINYYVVECQYTIFSVDVWENLSTRELYLIRNGICAYCGRYYGSGYYDIFEWYNGNIKEEEFSTDLLNEKQFANVKNISYIEKSRKQL